MMEHMDFIYLFTTWFLHKINLLLHNLLGDIVSPPIVHQVISIPVADLTSGQLAAGGL